MGIQKDTVKFNVGGKIFETIATTLANGGRNSLFGAMFDENWNLQTHNFDEYFIDRNPNCVAILLHLLVSRSSDPSNIPEKLIHREALFTSSTMSESRNGANSMETVRCMSDGPSTGDASPSGRLWRCQARHGSMVHVYDWMLEEHPPINLDYQKVNDVGWIDSETVVVTTCGLVAAVTGWVCLVQEQGSSGIDFKSLMMIK
ncbi:BTB/POZ domain-containing protein [Camellia lanceoleosa]|uniref:BTB/POZ domain-containing protein n=1 Tax=Camellia lanceoleosa TaxID=1840588 RepID=A0ACC0I6F2_9ERIC|nr:BTB/POZ domain-containing protein [Camellia lanceoleosa]